MLTVLIQVVFDWSASGLPCSMFVPMMTHAVMLGWSCYLPRLDCMVLAPHPLASTLIYGTDKADRLADGSKEEPAPCNAMAMSS